MLMLASLLGGPSALAQETTTMPAPSAPIGEPRSSGETQPVYPMTPPPATNPMPPQEFGQPPQPGMFPGQNGESRPPMQDDGMMQKRQEEMEKRQKEMEARGLEQMKRGLRMMEKNVAQMKKAFDRSASKGVSVPAECTAAIGTLQTLIDGLKAATTMDEVQSLNPEDAQDQFQILNECRQKIEMLGRIPQILRRVDSEIKKMERMWNRAKTKAPADAADAVADGDAILAEIKTARSKVNDMFKNGDVEDLQGTLEDEVFGRFDDLGGAIQRIEAVKNARRFFSEAPRRIRDAERVIARMKKAKEDTTDLERLLGEAKAQLATLKGMKPGSDEFQEGIDRLAEIGQEFAQATEGTEDLGRDLRRGPSEFGGSRDFAPSMMPKLPQESGSQQNGGAQNGSGGFGF